jgi:PRTRC genetic system protein E
MTMFADLYALATTATLSMVISADQATGMLTISVMPRPKKGGEEAALSKDLTLTGTPAEFDSGFVQALQGYSEARRSLSEQAEATREVLTAAQTASAQKAVEAAKKAGKGAKPEAVATTKDDDSDEEADRDEADGGTQTNEKPKPPSPAAGGADVPSLFG